MVLGKGLRVRVGPEHREIVRLLALCVLVGLVAGLGAVAFYYMLKSADYLFMNLLVGYRLAFAGHEEPLLQTSGATSPPLHRWLLLILPAAGGLLSGIIVFTLAPEAEGHGTDAAIDAYHFKAGAVRTRVPLVKMIASALTIGTGGSGGREGPIAQIGSGFGSILARLLRLPPHERRTLLAAGMGAGIGAIFHAPLAGAIFAAEVMYRELDIEHEILVPTFIASIVAYAVFGSVFGFHPLFITPDYRFNHVSVLLPYLILAAVCAGGAALYVVAFYGVRRVLLHGLRVPNHIKPAIGGLLVGVIGFLLPDALGSGYGVVQSIFYGEAMPARGGVDTLASWGWFANLFPAGVSSGTIIMCLLAVIALAKIATTALSIGSGGSGGVFGPAVVIGGALGGATGMFCQRLFPGIPLHPGAFALVGMAGFFAAAANTPISTIIMVSEMTGNYDLLVPSMLVCILAYVLCRRFNLYQKQLPSHLEAPSQMANMATAVLRTLTVGQALAGKKDGPPTVVPQTANFPEVMSRFAQSTQSCLPVVDAEGRLTGVIDTRDIRRVIREPGFEAIVIAQDLEAPSVTLTPADSLLTAIGRMVALQSDELVVVDQQEPRRIIGTIGRSDIIAAYDRRLIHGMV
jgi:chloride channel protein, CIC family